MSSIQVIKSLKSNVSDITKYRTVNASNLDDINNYFEVVSDKPARVFIDLDGKINEGVRLIKELHSNILEQLMTLEHVSIMSSLGSDKLSYRITYINEFCSNMKDMKIIVQNKKFKEIRRLLKKIIVVSCGDAEFNNLNIDMTVYRSNGKMRCVNAWKTDDDKTRINKLELGSITDTFIHYIHDECICWELPQKEEAKKEEAKKEEPLNINLNNIKNMALKMKSFNNYNEWLQLCFIIYNESNGSQAGKEVFIYICKTTCDNFNEEECNKKWYSTQNNKDKKLTIATLIKKYNEMYPNEIKSDDKKFNNIEYLKNKLEFEQRLFKLDTPFCYVKINNNDSLEFFDEPKLKQWTKGKFNKIMSNDKELNFIDLWLDDKNKKILNEIVFDPNPNNDNSKNYNCFKGFNYDENIKPVLEKDSAFLNLLKKITVEPHIYEYFKQWIGHIIQYPWLKTNSALVLYSDTKGVGKNCIIEGIMNLIKNYTGKVESIKDITKNFNSHLCNKLFIYGDEICAKAQDVSDALKNTITRKIQTLEKKGKDSLYLNDLSNWIFTTNNFNAFKVEQGDRRLGMIHCIEEKLNIIDSKEFFKEINDPNEINKLYNFFKNIKFTYNIVADSPPMTRYKQVLEYNNKSGYLQALYKEPFKFVENTFTSTELLKVCNEYCKQNYIIQTVDAVSFGKVINILFKDYKKRGDTCSKFNFKKIDLNKFNELLYNYDSEYWRHVNHYDETKPPNFNKIKKEKEKEVNALDA